MFAYAAETSARQVYLFFFILHLGQNQMRTCLNISLFSYLDRPIFDVIMNGTNFIGASANGFHGPNSVMVMQPLSLGAQTVNWIIDGPESAPRNGEVVTATNNPLLSDVPRYIKWLGLHFYSDATVEIKLSKGSPEELQTERGRKIIAAWEADNGR